MEQFIAIAVFLTVVWLFIKINQKNSKNEGIKSTVLKVYSYSRKSYIMTRAEQDFYHQLVNVISGEYLVFPQVHLSALFDHKINGQSWKHAFGHINGKSVDYVICKKQSLAPVIAVELDDYSHENESRRLRDSEVDRIFREANLPLLRFKNIYANDLGLRINRAIKEFESMGSEK